MDGSVLFANKLPCHLADYRISFRSRTRALFAKSAIHNRHRGEWSANTCDHNQRFLQRTKHIYIDMGQCYGVVHVGQSQSCGAVTIIQTKCENNIAFGLDDRDWQCERVKWIGEIRF